MITITEDGDDSEDYDDVLELFLDHSCPVLIAGEVKMITMQMMVMTRGY